MKSRLLLVPISFMIGCDLSFLEGKNEDDFQFLRIFILILLCMMDYVGITLTIKPPMLQMTAIGLILLVRE